MVLKSDEKSAPSGDPMVLAVGVRFFFVLAGELLEHHLRESLGARESPRSNHTHVFVIKEDV